MLACLIAAMAMGQDDPTGVTRIEGLVIARFEKPEGVIHVYLPGDMAAGDTISGVVIAVPAGDTDRERADNTATLRGMVVAIGDKEVPVSDGGYHVDVPEDGSDLELSSGRSATISLTPDPMDWALLETVFSAPEVAQARRPFVLSGPFDGDSTNTGVTIDGEVVSVLAESPRQAVVGSPSQPSPGATCQVEEGGQTTEHQIRFIKIDLTSPVTTLMQGQRTEVQLTVSGLEGLERPFKIRLTNKSPQIVSLEGGDEQDLEVTPDKVEFGGICGYALNLMAKTPGGYLLGAAVVPVANRADPPDGFKWDPDRPDVLIPDDTELEEGDSIKPKRFHPDAEDVPNRGGEGSWQKRSEPEEIELDDVTVWVQEFSSISYGRGDNIYRGGKYAVHFKYTGTECLPGKWRQIVRSTTYVGDSVDTLKPAHLVDDRMVPHDDADHKGDWEIDTNDAGRAAKNPDYPNQDKGEMLDTPKRSRSGFSGHYSKGDPPRTRAMVIRKEVEFYTFWIGPGGEICKIIKWGFVTTWVVPAGEDPFSEEGKNKADVSTTFTEPVEVDGDSDEGKAAKSAYEGAMEPFK